MRPQDLHYPEAPPQQPLRDRGGRSWWKPALIGFAVGVAASQALGLWTFVSHLVHGVPITSFNGAAKIAQTFDPEGWQLVSARWEQDHAIASGRWCISLTLPENGLAAGTAMCDQAVALRNRPGPASKGPRLALARPLFATTGEVTPKAPVAGWAAQIGATAAQAPTPAQTPVVSPAPSQHQARPAANATASSATPTVASPANSWATSTFSNANSN